MEIIDNKKQRNNNGLLVVALVLIGLGLVILARNMNFIDYWVYRIIVSWQSLLIIFGIWLLAKKDTTCGLIMVCSGVFCLIPKIARLAPDWLHTYWPLLLVFTGIIVLVNFFRSNNRPKHSCCCSENVDNATIDGFVDSRNTFSSAHHIVLDPVFRGARIRNTFGGAVLDLRKTALGETDTIIDIDCTFGGIKLFVPDNCIVIDRTKSFFGGVDNKRGSVLNDPDNPNRIIVMGNINFGGLEIRN